MLVELGDDEIRPISNWLRVSVIRAFKTRDKRRKGPSRLPEELRAIRPLQVMARITEDERDMLDVVAGEAGLTVSGWLRATVRGAYARLLQTRSNAS